MNALVSLLGIAAAVIILYGMQGAVEQRNSPAAQSNAMNDQPCPVRLGATADTIRRSGWGNPSRVNEHLTPTGTRQQWVYRLALFAAARAPEPASGIPAGGHDLGVARASAVKDSPKRLPY